MKPSGPQVAGEAASERLMRSLDYRLAGGIPRLSREQVAVVLHALADHTALTAALDYSKPEDGYWPEATSLGRWLHDTADQLEACWTFVPESNPRAAADGMCARCGTYQKDHR